VSSSADFSKESIVRRVASGYRDASTALANPPKATAALKASIAKQT
jgi:hypothetical protein